MTDHDPPPAKGSIRSAAAQSPFAQGATAGVGSLPHRDAVAAAAFSIGEFDIPSIPSLPNAPASHEVRGLMNRSGGSTLLAQAIAGLPGVTLDHGRIITDAALLTAPVGTALDDPSFAGLRAFLDLAAKINLDGQPITWQYTGPVTLGVALHDAGLDLETAFALAVRAVRTQLVHVAAAISAVMPTSSQMVLLDEPALADLMTTDFPVPPEHAVDMISSGMAALSSTAFVGIHCDRPCDIATLLSTGPSVVSVPIDAGLAEWAGYLHRFLDDGGVVAWGVVPIDGPVASTAERHWRALSDLWCELVRRGCDPVALRRQSLITPGGGLDGYAASVARRITRLTADVSKRVKDQANATRFALGA